jgi:hypothetical protein
LRANSEIVVIAPSDRCPTTSNFLSLDASLAIPTRVLRLEVSRLRRRTTVRSVLLTGQTGLMLLHLRLQLFGLGFVDQPRNQWFSGEPSETPRTRCCLCQSPLMTRLPRSPGSSFVLRLNQETHHVGIATMRPALDPASHRVPRTKPTCLHHI